MKIAIEGCVHGELNKIYETIQYIENREGFKVDLLICCGDFQSVRHHDDMISMAVPPKYREMKDFHDYYHGKKKAPVLTIFIGGNHEAANYLWELPFGGWVAENIYYMGFAGVINFGGLRIGGLSGIFKPRDYYKEHFEAPPFTEDTKRSFYHVRSIDVAKLKLLSQESFDIFLSHDWPKRIYHYGDKEQLIRFKPFLKDEIYSNTLGSDAAEDLLKTLAPTYWFSAHMHAKFSAIVEHKSGKVTKFLALDKCLPKRNFLQIIDIAETADEQRFLKYDKHWLTVIKATENLSNKFSRATTELSNEYIPNETRLEALEKMCQDFTVLPFAKSVNGENPQTRLFCEKFDIVNSFSLQPKVENTRRFVSGGLRLPPPVHHAVEQNEEGIKAKETGDDDDFSELTNPNISSNPDEIELNESSDASEGSADDVAISEQSELPSFIETPAATKINTSLNAMSDMICSDTAPLSSCTSDETCNETPVPKKKFKLVRRNQLIYNSTNDEDEGS